METNVLPAYEVEDLTKLAWQFIGRHNFRVDDIEDILAVYIAAGYEAGLRFDPEKSGAGVRGYQTICAEGQALNFIRDRVRETRGITASLSQQVGGTDEEEGGTLADLLPEKEAAAHLDEDERAKVAEAVAGLSEQQSAVVTAVYWREITLTEAAKEMGVSLGRAGQLHKEALTILKHRLKNMAGFAAA